MQSDFEPKKLKEANEKLEKHLNTYLEKREIESKLEKESGPDSLWKKILRLFR